jgi:hypothetical protein
MNKRILMKTKLSVTGIAIGFILILIGFFESNVLSSDAQKFFSGSSEQIAFWFLAVGTIIISGGVLSFARAVTE